MAKRALCVGINDYPGTGSDLAGCVNDANDWKAALESRGFQVDLLLDKQATKQAMRDKLQKLVADAKSGDVAIFTYSGHGTWVPDEEGDEPDGRDEALCPHDIGQNRPLLDDEMREIFMERERGSKIVLVSDSCHSGTVTRFAPIANGSEAKTKVRFLPPETFLPANRREIATRIARSPVRRGLTSSALLMSGCADPEFSYDAYFGGRPNGAFSYFALKALKALPAKATFRDWHRAIRESLPSASYPQTPKIDGTSSQKGWAAIG